jgi:two-component system sensor histidine kinase RegB
MPNSSQPYQFDGLADRSNWVRMRTLALLRWMAIAGQLAAIFIAWRFFQIAINPFLCLSIVGLSVLANIVSSVRYPQNRRLSETEALATLLFDSSQLALLLYITGGLNNPFALLLLAPATIAATALEDRSTAIVGALTILFVTFLAVFHLPLSYRDGQLIEVPDLFGFGFWVALVIGVVFLALYARRVSGEIHAMSDALLATQMALAREQKLTDLSGVVAAAAHELGTPLATIKLAAAELSDELVDLPELREDADLIRSQADRCRDILRSMGRAGKDDRQMHAAPFAGVVQEAAEPHMHRKARLHFALPTERIAEQPLLPRRPEIIHGLRNLVQNAVDFSRKNVWIDLDWTDTTIVLRITDDGSGFPSGVIGRIGDPFMRHQRAAAPTQDLSRPHYEGMGLGLFIAKTLLERTGAQLRFGNALDPFLTDDERPERCGAVVEVTWPRTAIEVPSSGPQGENSVISA